MVEQEARVITVEGDQLLLEAETQSSCSACEVKSGCGTSVLSRWVGRKFTRFSAKNTVAAEPGDHVVVGLSESALVHGSLTVYLLPLLGMIVSALIADFLVPQDTRAAHDLAVAAAGIGGFVAMLLLCRFYLTGQQLKQELTPVVLRKIIGRGRIST